MFHCLTFYFRFCNYSNLAQKSYLFLRIFKNGIEFITWHWIGLKSPRQFSSHQPLRCSTSSNWKSRNCIVINAKQQTVEWRLGKRNESIYTSFEMCQQLSSWFRYSIAYKAFAIFQQHLACVCLNACTPIQVVWCGAGIGAHSVRTNSTIVAHTLPSSWGFTISADKMRLTLEHSTVDCCARNV